MMHKESVVISAESTAARESSSSAALKLSSNEEEHTDAEPTVHWYYAVLLGFGMKLGGCTIAWNYGLKIGFWQYFLMLGLMGFAYICQGLCLAELMSIIPFPGGYYGYSRCALGPLFGYLVGCCGILESIFQLCVSVLKLSQFITTAFHIDDHYEPIWWALTFLATIGIHVLASKGVWYWMITIITSCLCLVLIYLLGSIPHLDTSYYALTHASVVMDTDPLNVLNSFRLTMLFFIGYDMITLTTSEIIQPRQTMPKAILTLVLGLFLFAIWIFLTVVSQSPGITLPIYQKTTFFPLIFGFENLFHFGSTTWALFCAFLPSIATILAYSYVVGKQVLAMSKSGLLPSVFQYTYGPQRIPLSALSFISVFGWIGLWYCKMVDPYTALSRVSTLAASCNYLALFACYTVFNTRYSNMERTFVNPLGQYSVYYGSIVYSTIIIVIFFCNPDYYLIPVFFLAYLFIMIVYYYAYAEQAQCFSMIEQKHFFKAYVVNMKKRQKQSIIYRALQDLCTCGGMMRVPHGIFPWYRDNTITSNNSGGGQGSNMNTKSANHPPSSQSHTSSSSGVAGYGLFHPKVLPQQLMTTTMSPTSATAVPPQSFIESAAVVPSTIIPLEVSTTHTKTTSIRKQDEELQVDDVDVEHQQEVSHEKVSARSSANSRKYNSNDDNDINAVYEVKKDNQEVSILEEHDGSLVADVFTVNTQEEVAIMV